jgi:hypothetical protein
MGQEAGEIQQTELIDRLEKGSGFKQNVREYWVSRGDVGTEEQMYNLYDEGVYSIVSGWTNGRSGERNRIDVVSGTYLDAIVRLLEDPSFFGERVECWDIGHSHNGFIEKQEGTTN